MEKYYDLIVSMIKSHRKYPGCESIIDDIVSDVYSHAEVVLNTVTNESVITSYLNKIVSTSMITVPKRLGIDTHNKPETTVSKPVEVAPVHITENAEEEEKDIEPLEMEVEEEILEEEQEESPAETEELLEEAPAVTEELEPGPAPDVDKSLVDKMINGVPGEDQFLEEDLDSIDNLTLDDISTDVQGDLEVEEEPAEETDEDAEELTEAEKEENDDETEDETEEIEELTDDVEQLNDIEQLDDVEPLDCESLEELEVQGEVDSLTDELEAAELSPAEQTNEELSPEEQADEDESDFATPSFDCFEYEPEEEEPEYEPILMDDLKSLEASDTDTMVVDVCRLKYKKHYSVDKIAETLGLSQAQVLDILDKVINLVEG